LENSGRNIKMKNVDYRICRSEYEPDMKTGTYVRLSWDDILDAICEKHKCEKRNMWWTGFSPPLDIFEKEEILRIEKEDAYEQNTSIRNS